MATPFEEFIQTELPRRPYLLADVAAESVIIRRGSAPRQLDGLLLQEGEVLGMKDGQLQGVGSGGGGSFAGGYTHEQETAATTWTVTHNRNNSNVAGVTVINAAGNVVIPDAVSVTANTVVLSFSVQQAGKATLVFV
jgi:hypothetical protein